MTHAGDCRSGTGKAAAVRWATWRRGSLYYGRGDAEYRRCRGGIHRRCGLQRRYSPAVCCVRVGWRGNSLSCNVYFHAVGDGQGYPTGSHGIAANLSTHKPSVSKTSTCGRLSRWSLTLRYNTVNGVQELLSVDDYRRCRPLQAGTAPCSVSRNACFGLRGSCDRAAGTAVAPPPIRARYHRREDTIPLRDEGWWNNERDTLADFAREQREADAGRGLLLSDDYAVRGVGVGGAHVLRRRIGAHRDAGRNRNCSHHFQQRHGVISAGDCLARS